jgi:hypothetical protein
MWIGSTRTRLAHLALGKMNLSDQRNSYTFLGSIKTSAAETKNETPAIASPP